MTKKTALITGISGQDGAYLAKLLLNKGYEVHGVVREKNKTCENLDVLDISHSVFLHECSLNDQKVVTDLIQKLKPQEVYNLAAQSSVRESFEKIADTINFNVNSLLNILEAVRIESPNTKVFHAGSSEIFSPSNEKRYTLDSKIGPTNPYGISKTTNFFTAKVYRETYQLFVVTGILFPHESILRKDTSFLKSLIRSAHAISQNKHTNIVLNNIENERDFGRAEKFVEAMHLSLQAETPRDYIISSGRSIKIKNIVDHVIQRFPEAEQFITFDQPEKDIRETTVIIGDNSETSELLNWHYDENFYDVIDEMIDFEINHTSLL